MAEKKVIDRNTGIMIVPDRDNRLTEFSKKLITDYYLKDGESIQEGFARAAFAWSSDDAHAQRLYDAVSLGWFMFASPVFSNAPRAIDPIKRIFEKAKGLPISCFSSMVQDSLEGLIEHTSEVRWLSVLGGGVGASWSAVRPSSKKSPGSIPFIHTMDADMEAYKQGSCYTPETEILTSTGWKRFDALDGSEVVCQIDDNNKASFVKPTEFVKEYHKGKIINFISKNRICASVTPNHSMVVERKIDNTWTGKLEKIRADEVEFDSNVRMYFSTVPSKEAIETLSSIEEISDKETSEEFKKEEVDYDGFVYCCLVPTGKIMVRHDGQPLVCGNTRRGSYAAYMDVSHPDIVEFINLRLPTGDTSRKCHSAGFHNAVNITDKFMEAVKRDDDWDLIDPSDKSVRDTVKARELWNQILDIRYRTGEPYLHFIDTANRALPEIQKELGLEIKSSNLCVAPETLVLTYNGEFEISSLEGKTIKVWNGSAWSETVVHKTGENQKLLTVKFSNGKYIDCTEYHKFYIDNNVEVRAKDLKAGDKITSYVLPIDGDFVEYDISVVSVDDSGRISDTFCFTEPEENKGVFNGILTGNCAEIELPTNEDRTFVCCLSSLNLEKYDEWKETSIVRDLIRMLDNIITFFCDNAPDVIAKARYSAFRERALGLGVMGFHNLLMKNMIPFESIQAKELNKNLFKYIESEAKLETYKMGKEYGEAPDIQTTLIFDFGNEEFVSNSSEFIGDKRAFEYKVGDTIDDYGTILNISGLHDYSGRRNTQLMALAPTANSAILCGTSPSIEPVNSNAYVHQTRAGSWFIKNAYLEKLLDEKGQNTSEVWKEIIGSEGSVKNLAFLTEHEKKVFKTAIELNQMWVVEHAADRQPYISQGQSINLFFPARCERAYFGKVHYAAWKKGLKSLYYIRTMAGNKADAVSKKVERVALKDADDGECLACQG